MARPILSARQCASVLRALGDETRLYLLQSLLRQEKCVMDLVRELRRYQPHISHHLRVLRECGLVEGMREGKHVCYRVAPRLRRALRDRAGRVLDFGCCQISFPERVLYLRTRRARARLAS
jgi:DNA-binding transcriptional ArsR family regulator